MRVDKQVFFQIYDERQFDISGINQQQKEDLIEILKYVRLPLIPAEIIIQRIEPSNLIEKHDLYVAMAFQAAPDCFKQDKSDKFRHRYGSEVPWCWSKEHHGPHILLSNNFKTAHGCHYDWEKIVGNVIWRSGTHKFSIHINGNIIELNMLASSNTWQIIVGVAAVPQTGPPINLQNHLGFTAKEWGMMCLSGQKINKNIPEDYIQGSRRGDYFLKEKGDVIGVIVDLNTGRLEFTKNGISLGIAYENVKGPVSPCISLLKGQKITLLTNNSLLNQKNATSSSSTSNTSVLANQIHVNSNFQQQLQLDNSSSPLQGSVVTGTSSNVSGGGATQIQQQQQQITYTNLNSSSSSGFNENVRVSGGGNTGSYSGNAICKIMQCLYIKLCVLS